MYTLQLLKLKVGLEINICQQQILIQIFLAFNKLFIEHPSRKSPNESKLSQSSFNSRSKINKIMEVLSRKRAKSSIPRECKFYKMGCCRFGNKCRYVHVKKEKKTKRINFSDDKALMEQSRDKICGVCFEKVVNKGKYSNYFGVLSHCYHCFCFSCIQKWRKSINFNSDVTKACPECRVISTFVYKSLYWVDKENKEKFLEQRNKILSEIDCKYFRKGRGVCKLGSDCLFKHELSSGIVLEKKRQRDCARRTLIAYDEFDEASFDVYSVISDDLDFVAFLDMFDEPFCGVHDDLTTFLSFNF